MTATMNTTRTHEWIGGLLLILGAAALVAVIVLAIITSPDRNAAQAAEFQSCIDQVMASQGLDSVSARSYCLPSEG